MFGSALLGANGSGVGGGGSDLSVGLVAHYLLANNADDSCGEYDGTSVGDVVYNGDAAEFDGDCHIGISSLNSIRETFTISFWVNRNNECFPYQDDNILIRIGAASNRIIWWENNNGTGDYVFMDMSPLPAIGTMAHVVITSDHRVYLDGVDVSTAIGSTNTTSVFRWCGIARYYYGNGSAYSNHTQSNTRIYSDEKDQAFVDQLFAEGH